MWSGKIAFYLALVGAILPTECWEVPVKRNGEQCCSPSPFFPLPEPEAALWEGQQQALCLEQGHREQKRACQMAQLLVSTKALHPLMTSEVTIWGTPGSLVCSSGRGRAIQIMIPSSSVLGLYNMA